MRLSFLRLPPLTVLVVVPFFRGVCSFRRRGDGGSFCCWRRGFCAFRLRRRGVCVVRARGALPPGAALATLVRPAGPSSHVAGHAPTAAGATVLRRERGWGVLFYRDAQNVVWVDWFRVLVVLVYFFVKFKCEN
jgi:hypothetical protein